MLREVFDELYRRETAPVAEGGAGRTEGALMASDDVNSVNMLATRWARQLNCWFLVGAQEFRGQPEPGLAAE